MAIIKDPENNETSSLHALVDFSDRSVLEIGCGDGRLTWRYADQAKQVTAIDPDEQAVRTAQDNLPERLQERIRFFASNLEDFVESYHDRKFDLAIFSWSL